MTREEIKKAYDICAEKSGVLDWGFTLDKYEDRELYIDENDIFYINSIKTPYTLADFKEIKWRNEVLYEEELQYIIIRFFNGEYIRFDICVDVEARFEGKYHNSIVYLLEHYKDYMLAKEQNLDYVIKDNVLTYVKPDVTEIKIPEGVMEIKERVFWESPVEKVLFPSTLKKIGDRCFVGCESLENVVLNEGLERIEECAFYRCSKLSGIDIPKSVNFVGESAFKYTNVEKIVLHNKKTKVEETDIDIIQAD